MRTDKEFIKAVYIPSIMTFIAREYDSHGMSESTLERVYNLKEKDTHELNILLKELIQNIENKIEDITFNLENKTEDSKRLLTFLTTYINDFATEWEQEDGDHAWLQTQMNETFFETFGLKFKQFTGLVNDEEHVSEMSDIMFDLFIDIYELASRVEFAK